MKDAWTERLSEYLDDELTPAERLSLEQHLLDCAACREVLDELREVVSDARDLTDEPPARDLWPALARALPRPAPMGWRVNLSLPQAIAASLLLMVASGTGVWMLSERQIAPMMPVDDSSRPAVVPAGFSDPKYDRAVVDLTRVLEEGRGRLNPRTVAVLEKNLATIDRAIAEARAALERDPGDPFLNRHLADQRQRKLTLLREAKNLVRTGP